MAAANTASSTNYFTLRTETVNPVNDTLRLNPNVAEHLCKMFVVANFDGYLDHWYLQMTHPIDMPVYVYYPIPNYYENFKVTEGPDMQVPYIDSEGNNQVFYADLTTKMLNLSSTDTTKYTSHFSSTINTMGYWDQYNNNHYESYGTVKWATGYYDNMFTLSFYIPYGKINLNLILDLILTSTTDWRGVPTVNAHPIRNFHIHVGYQRGDVNGDGLITITDVSQLQDWLLFGFESATPYQLDAADVDVDGVVDISDVAALIDILGNL
jgi:hypothetical protein